MPAQALYLKWRPRTFEDVIGQDQIIRTLRNAIIQNRVRHAYLLNGPRGTGKTTLARLLAKAVNCQNPDPAVRPCGECQFCREIEEGRFMDLIEIDAASHNGVDDVRDLREKIAFAPSEGRYKVYIIDEVHRFSGAAFDALLKTLEEPPEHAIFILATTELDKVPATIKSRSLMFENRRVSTREVADRLQMICDHEGIQAERGALELVARAGTGSVRDSISLLDQLISDPDQPVTVEMTAQVLGTASYRAVGKLVQAIIEDNVADGLDVLNQAIDEGADPTQLGRQIVEYMRNLMLVQVGGPVDISNEIFATLKQQSSRISRGALIRAIRSFNAALTDMRGGWQPQLPLELAVIDSTRPLHEDVVVAASEVAARAPEPSAPSGTVEHQPARGSKIPVKPAAVAPATPAKDEEPEVISLAQMQKAWPIICRVVREQPKLKALNALLAYASVKSVQGKTVTLAVNGSVQREKLDAEDKRKALAEIVKSVVKAPMQIKLVEAAAAATTDGLPDDDLVSFITNELGGTITGIEDSQGGDD